MVPLSRRSFRRRVTLLDGDGFVAFVAALYEARGAHVEREGALLRLDGGPPDVGSETLSVDTGRVGPVAGSPDDVAVDAVVTRRGGRPWSRLDRDGSASGDGPRIVDAAALHEMLLYALDREVADDLCRTHLGVPVDRPPGTTLRERVPNPDARAVVLVLVGVALLTGAAWGSGVGQGLFEDRSAAEGPGFVTPDVTTERQTPAAGERASIPGIEGDTAELYALAGHHATQLANTSYRIVFRYNGTIDADTPSTRWAWSEQLVLANGTGHYRYRGYGDDLYDRDESVVRWSSYANGTTAYVRRGGTNASFYRRPANFGGDRYGRFPTRTRVYLLRYFPYRNVSVERVRTDGPVRYRLESEHHPDRARLYGATNYSVVATVGDDGIVRSLDVEYHTRNGFPVSMSFRIDRIGETTVPRPAWYDDAVNATTPGGRDGGDGTADDGEGEG